MHKITGVYLDRNSVSYKTVSKWQKNKMAFYAIVTRETHKFSELKAFKECDTIFIKFQANTEPFSYRIYLE